MDAETVVGKMVLRLLRSNLDLKTQVELAMGLAAEVARADHGFIVFDEGGKLRVMAARGQMPDADFSSTIVKLVLARKQPLVVRDPATDVLTRGSTSIAGLRLSSVVALPLTAESTTLGVLYLDRRGSSEPFQESDLAVLQEFVARITPLIRSLRHERDISENQERLLAELRRRYDFSGIKGGSVAVAQVLKSASKAAASEEPVLITGESGTGKELVARAIHYNSRRATMPFVAINCAALPENLIESELFGASKGSFTGATQALRGKFEAADRGTIFLDEISEMPGPSQAKLLRAVQFGEIQKVGSPEVMRVDVRMIAATNRDLRAVVQAGGFRQDLFYRLNVVTIEMPPLRERRDDITELVEYFTSKIGGELEHSQLSVSPDAMALLKEYSYPGNVRELENILRRAIAMCDTQEITPADLPRELVEQRAEFLHLLSVPTTGAELQRLKKLREQELETEFAKYLLKRAKGNVTHAAELGSVDRTWLQKLIARLNIEPDDFKQK